MDPMVQTLSVTLFAWPVTKDGDRLVLVDLNIAWPQFDY
jgi:hypothetical protein